MKLGLAILLLITAAQAGLAAPPANSAQELRELFGRSDETFLRLNPLSALYRGIDRHPGELGDLFGEERAAQSYRAAQADLAGLDKISRDTLTAADQVAYDAFRWKAEMELASYSPQIRALSGVLPIDHFSGIQTWYPELSSGLGAARYETIADYDANIARHRNFALQIDVAIARFRDGIKSGIVQPTLTVRKIIEQLDQQIVTPVEFSPYLAPIRAFPASIRETERARLAFATNAVVRERVLPAYVRLRDFLVREYLPAARDGVGLVHMKGGSKLYRHLIYVHTTLPMAADDVHKLGLAEVARINREMEKIRSGAGFVGTLAEFYEYVRGSRKFKYQSDAEMAADFAAIAKRVDARIGEQFSTIPRSLLDMRRVPAERATSSSAGTYLAGTPDGSRPGIFYFNSYDLPSRSRLESETLYLHEAVPGHHFQTSLAQEDASLPAFLRFGESTAFVEGWGLYAETLWAELGVETDPYARFGGLNKEMTRALRLVVDSGLHAKGWTREQAIDYMLANSGMTRGHVSAEVDRYIAIPGQALSYKIGELTISRLKRKAQQSQASLFDPRRFHAQVLMSGVLPLGVLERKIETWIAGGGI